MLLANLLKKFPMEFIFTILIVVFVNKKEINNTKHFKYNLKMLKRVLFFVFFINAALLSANRVKITVAQDGSGDFTTITAALQSLPMFNYERVVIYIKKGIYNEKIKITQDYVTLLGEDRENTTIAYNQLRSDWDAHKDSIGPAVVNIYADDIVLSNLTIKNTQLLKEPHAFTIYGTGTRTITINCTIESNGGDTVSLWNYKNGMYYHANCSFTGSVDFVCPRGWCYIRDSRFYEHRKTASVWHAGSYSKDQKFAIVNSFFDGVEGFELGRHHYDACFYFIGCNFSKNLKDTPIYRVTYKDSTQNRPFNWGKRYFYYNCKKEGMEFGWLKDNITKHDAEEINCQYVFEGKWNPESKEKLQIKAFKINNNYVLLEFEEPLTVEGSPELKTSSGKVFRFESGNGSNCLRFISDFEISKPDLENITIHNGIIYSSIAGVYKREVDLNSK